MIIAPVAAPLLTAAVLIAAPLPLWLRRAAGAAASVIALATAAWMLPSTLDGSVAAVALGGWPADVAITFAADTFSLLMVCTSAVLVLVSLAFAAATGDDMAPGFTALVLVLSSGVYGAFLTADLFNLFVFIEVMLVPSYVLLVLTGNREQAAAGRIYITVNLLASTVFLAGIAMVYGVVGTVNLGRLAAAAAEPNRAALAAGVVLLALAIKSAVVPMHGWLPRTYPKARPAVTLLFSGLLTKVAVYAIIRIYAVVFDGAPWLRWLILVAALLSMLVGVIGALGESSMRHILAFHMVSQIGYILLGLAVFTTGALAAAIFFTIQYVLVKAALFACAGAIETRYGTGRVQRLGGLAKRHPALAAAFMVAALSLAGLPPLSGFVAKLSLLSEVIADAAYLAAGIAVVVSLLTLLSMLKIWSGVFWGEPQSGQEHETTPIRRSLVTPALALAVPSLALGIAAQPLLAAAIVAAGGLTGPASYIQAVIR